MLEIHLDLNAQKSEWTVLEFSQHDLSAQENTWTGQNWANHIH